jgi:hypothetical protein
MLSFANVRGKGKMSSGDEGEREGGVGFSEG